MGHFFNDKIFLFIGNPVRCTRQSAREKLEGIGGVLDERITMFTHYVVAFNGAKKTKLYQKALERENLGQLILLDEEQFFDILDGRTEPPAKKVSEIADGIIVIPPNNPDADVAQHESVEQYVLMKKRIKNELRKNSIAGESNVGDLGFKTYPNVNMVIQNNSSDKDFCDVCGNLAKIFIGDGFNSATTKKLCTDCYNRHMAEMTNTTIPLVIPKKLSFDDRKGKVCVFDIELMIFPNGKSLTATEIGKTIRKTDVHGELEDDVSQMFEKLSKQIKKLLSTSYIQPDGYFKKSKAVGYVQYNSKRDACDVIIDGKPYTWSELEKNIRAHEGWKIKIEFGDVGDELD